MIQSISLTTNSIFSSHLSFLSLQIANWPCRLKQSNPSNNQTRARQCHLHFFKNSPLSSSLFVQPLKTRAAPVSTSLPGYLQQYLCSSLRHSSGFPGTSLVACWKLKASQSAFCWLVVLYCPLNLLVGPMYEVPCTNHCGFRPSAAFTLSWILVTSLIVQPGVPPFTGGKGVLPGRYTVSF